MKIIKNMQLRWLTGEMGQNLIFPLVSLRFQNGLNGLSIRCGFPIMVDNVRGGISKCIGKTKVCKLLRLQKIETAIFIYIYSSLANF